MQVFLLLSNRWVSHHRRMTVRLDASCPMRREYARSALGCQSARRETQRIEPLYAFLLLDQHLNRIVLAFERCSLRCL